MTLLLAGCADHSLEASIREDSAKRSASDCSGKRRKCEFFITKMRSGDWGVVVTPVILDDDGKRVWVPGGGRNYWYSADGKFVREMPGL